MLSRKSWLLHAECGRAEAPVDIASENGGNLGPVDI